MQNPVFVKNTAAESVEYVKNTEVGSAEYVKNTVSESAEYVKNMIFVGEIIRCGCYLLLFVVVSC